MRQPCWYLQRIAAVVAVALLPARSAGGATLVCVGDSITAGESVTPAQCYVGRLRDERPGLAVVADGRSGWTTGGFAADLKAAAAKVPADADVVTILLGTNDARSTEPPDRIADAAAANVAKLVAAYHARAPRARFVIVGPTAIEPARMSDRLRQANYTEATVPRLAAIRAAYQQSAEKLGCRYVDLAHVPTAGHTVDGVHPDAVGHRQIAAVLWPAINARLPPPPGGHRPTGKLVCVGASITDGVGAPRKSLGYVARLAALAKDQHVPLTVVGDGRSGWSTVDYLHHADAVVAKMPADATVVTFQLGGNDARTPDATDVMAARAADGMARLIALYRAKAPHAAFVLMSPTRFDVAKMGPGLRHAGYSDATPARMAAIGDAYRTLAAAHGWRYIDLLAVPAAGHTAEGLHPDAIGHAEVADAIWAALSTPLPTTRP